MTYKGWLKLFYFYDLFCFMLLTWISRLCFTIKKPDLQQKDTVYITSVSAQLFSCTSRSWYYTLLSRVKGWGSVPTGTCFDGVCRLMLLWSKKDEGFSCVLWHLLKKKKVIVHKISQELLHSVIYLESR